MKEIKEHIGFQRGMDPKESMKIGLTAKRVFESQKEMVDWILLFPRIVTENLFDSWNPKDLEENWNAEWGKNFYNFTEDSNYSKLRMVKWIKNNLSMKYTGGEYDLGLKESKEVADAVCEKIYKNKITESQNFERGIDPKDAMGIGNQLYRQNLEVLRQTLVAFPWIEDNPEIYASRLTDLGVKIISINQKTSNFFVFHWLNSRGGMQLRTIKLPKDNWVNLFAAVAGMIREIESIKEALHFERGKDPKSSMRIGVPTWSTIQRGDLLEVPKIIPLSSDNEIVSNFNFKPVSDLPDGVILEVEELDDASSKEWILWFTYYVDINDFKTNRGDHTKERHGYVKGTPKQFHKLFQFLPRSMNEVQNFERGVDPKSSMNIGKRSMIENWLKEHNLFEDTYITEDLRINTAKDVQVVIHLKNLGESLPEYIQFGTVVGGFDVQKNNLKTLRGCPKRVIGTNNLKGNFKCNNNQLTSLEGGPQRVDGNYLCFDNPGRFSQKDIRRICKVTGAAWGDEKVEESMGFERTGHPLDTMNLGYEAQIKNWLKACGISNDEIESFVDYRINKDGTIDVLEDINLVGAHIEDFPYFIRFNKIYGSFYVANNKFTNLNGFPKEVEGDLSIYSNVPGAKKWKENEIRKNIKVKGTIWN